MTTPQLCIIESEFDNGQRKATCLNHLTLWYNSMMLGLVEFHLFIINGHNTNISPQQTHFVGICVLCAS